MSFRAAARASRPRGARAQSPSDRTRRTSRSRSATRDRLVRADGPQGSVALAANRADAPFVFLQAASSAPDTAVAYTLVPAVTHSTASPSATVQESKSTEHDVDLGPVFTNVGWKCPDGKWLVRDGTVATTPEIQLSTPYGVVSRQFARDWSKQEKVFFPMPYDRLVKRLEEYDCADDTFGMTEGVQKLYAATEAVKRDPRAAIAANVGRGLIILADPLAPK